MNIKNSEKILKSLGERLKKAREEAKLTQAEVAKAAGMHVNYYAQIERGEINTSYGKLQAITTALKIKSLDMS